MAHDHPVWHVLSTDEVMQRLEVNPHTGLSTDEAKRRRGVYGPNEIQEQRRRGPWRMLLDQFTDFMILVLMAAAVISGVIGEPGDTIAIVVIVLLNGVIGFVQEYRADRAVATLKRLAAPTARARREGQVVTMPAEALVPGDLVLLEAGNIVPADMRLLEAIQLKAEEAALTGESMPVDKQMSSLPETDVPVGDRLNMVYKGTLITYGRGGGVVVAIGMQTQLGQVAALLHNAEEVQTPLQRRLAHFGQRLAWAALAICAGVFVVGVLRGEAVVRMLLTAVSLAVAAIPEALPALVTVSLALGARSMVKQNALVRRLPAVETLGSVTYICSDKTGTLTQNRMQVEQLSAYGVAGHLEQAAPAHSEEMPWHLLYQALALSTDTIHNERGDVIGDPTEVALYEAAHNAGYDKAVLEATAPRLAELPFDSDRKCMTTFHQGVEGVIAFTKGAPEQVLERCDTAHDHGGCVPLQPTQLLGCAEQMAAAGLRVLAVAYRDWPEVPSDLSPDHVESTLTFLGLVGLLDPPREEVAAALALCTSAGIMTVMITGDHPTTAHAIARRLGIVANGDAVMTGQELARLSPQAFAEQVEQIRIYARVAPEQKIAIVKALQDRGEFVAMTGDGINDAPALQRADIGVAMGITGTDVAREAAHMILLDDNFVTIVAAVRTGRRIFDNIRKFIKYAMTGNAGEIWTIFLAPFLGLPIPLLPIHILWINLVTDGLPGLALAAEPEETGLMQRPPRPPGESLFAHGMWQHIIWVGLLISGVSLVAQGWAYHTGSAHWQTIVFTVLTLSQMGHVLAIRAERASFLQQGPGSNLPLLGAVLLTFGLQMATIYLPALTPIFKTAPLSGSELLVCLALSSVVFVAVEIEKWMIRRGWLYQNASSRQGRRDEQ